MSGETISWPERGDTRTNYPYNTRWSDDEWDWQIGTAQELSAPQLAELRSQLVPGPIRRQIPVPRRSSFHAGERHSFVLNPPAILVRFGAGDHRDRRHGRAAVAGDHIKVDLSELQETASALAVVKGEFDDAGDIAAAEKESLGDDDIWHAVHGFATDWNVHKKKLGELLDTIMQMAQNGHDLYVGVDQKLASGLANALSGDGSTPTAAR